MDYCLRGIALNEEVRFFCATSRELVDTGRRCHETSPTATAALGRTLTMTVMMGMNLKGDDTLALTFRGDGPLGTVSAVANAHGEVKGYVDHPEVDLPRKSNGKLDVGSGIGFGTLQVKKDMGLKEPYIGSVPIVTGEVGEDVMEYFYSSEQTPSAVGVGVLVDVDLSVKAAGGFIFQLLPGATEETIAHLEEKVAGFSSISHFFEENMPEDLLDYFFDENYKVLDKREIHFKCACGRENFERALISLGKTQLEELVEKDGIEVVCQFCNEKYIFSKEDVSQITKDM